MRFAKVTIDNVVKPVPVGEMFVKNKSYEKIEGYYNETCGDYTIHFVGAGKISWDKDGSVRENTIKGRLTPAQIKDRIDWGNDHYKNAPKVEYPNI